MVVDLVFCNTHRHTDYEAKKNVWIIKDFQMTNLSLSFFTACLSVALILCVELNNKMSYTKDVRKKFNIKKQDKKKKHSLA